MKRVILILAFMLCASEAWATVYPVTSCTSANVQDAMDDASSSGDEVFLDCATGSWTTQVSWIAPANAILRGRGSTSIIGGSDLTVITDNYTTNLPMLSITTNASGTFRMYGITFQGGTGVLKDNGTILIGGTGTQTRIDHIHWDGTTYSSTNNGKWMNIAGCVRGVLDHSILDLVNISWTHITNGCDFAGNTTWSQATGFGGSDFFYIEDNEVNAHVIDNTVYYGTLTDCHTGGKFVVRFNTMIATAPSQTHPTGHAGDDRGCRAHETYGNLITSPLAEDPNYAMDYNNSGGAMVWNNEALQVFKNIIYMNNCRSDGACGYTQTVPPGGWGYCGTTFSGTGSNWDRNDSAPTGFPCIDQAGRGQGDLLSGLFSSKINNRTGTVAWPEQVLEPQYLWMNNASIVSGWGGSYYSVDDVVNDGDYYRQASGVQTNATTPFNGTTGTGWGTLANRPTTCTTGAESGGGVGYFATDQGLWNTSSSNSWGVQMSGADGILYKCTATNTWTAYYTPYTYPHPLQNIVPETHTPAVMVPMRMILLFLLMVSAMAIPPMFKDDPDGKPAEQFVMATEPDRDFASILSSAWHGVDSEDRGAHRELL